MFSISDLPQSLKPLILFCQPEQTSIAQQALEYHLPAFLTEPHYAVSESARKKGWLHPIAKQYRTFCAADLENLTLKLELYDLLIVNPLSLNTLAKLALGIVDSFPTKIFNEFATLGKPIFLCESSLPTEQTEINPHLHKIYKTHWENLMSGTITGFNEKNLELKIVKAVRSKTTAQKQISLSGTRVFVTKDDIITAAESLHPLKVPYGSIITDLAKEEALVRNVTIIFE